MKGIFYLILLLSVRTAFSQSIEQYAENLNRLKTETSQKYLEQRNRVNKYAEENSLPISYRDNKGNLVVLIDVTPLGEPVYITTDNIAASQTIGAHQLQQGGSLGLNVSGENITIGVWDGGIVASHIEFENRLLSSEGTALDDHATHVSGTIASGGISNPNSRGMAPKAKIYAWDFNNDEPEVLTMVKPDQTTLLLSNHSYGLITGWRFNNGWQWFGNSSVSTLEDYRFGFYNGRSRAWDEIMFNAPYYTMVKSAGNDRSDVGNGTIPADCNGGAGYDCLGDIAVCKNNIVVGAVAKQPNYTGPESVVMSSFSSWGPSDDGRIKPDLVAAGVGLLSTIATGSNSYGSLSGTSMATPSVTGGLALLQDLHKQLTGTYMLSSTLKALAIHTTKEAGPTPGPDYSFGWGLLDVEKAAKLLLDKDGVNTIINEVTLLNNQIYELPLTPVENEKITITIAWTDPAGNPVAVSLDPITPMLVNDLDVRIVDDGGTMQFPWKLNPQDFTSEAVKGDNTLDNVEKIEFQNPQSRNYKVRVSHKGQLVNGQQTFSIILTYKSLNNGGQTLYWVGGSGEWSDQNHWSLSSGGTPAGLIPTLNDRIFFDENSFLENSSLISLSTDAEAGSIAWFSNKTAKIDLNGHQLILAGGMVLSNSSLSLEEGTIRMIGTLAVENTISFANNLLPNVSIVFDGDSGWKLRGSAAINQVKVDGGNIDLEDQEIIINELVIADEFQGLVNIQGSKISGLEYLHVSSGQTLTSEGTSFFMGTNGIIEAGSFSMSGKIITSPGSQVDIFGNATFSNLDLSGSVTLFENCSISNLELNAGSSLILAAGSTQIITGGASILGTSSQRAIIKSNSESKAFLNFVEYQKICFDYIDIENVNVLGLAVVNAGSNSSLSNSDGWLLSSCEEILFPNFSIDSFCAGALVSFENLSQGNIDHFEWNFNSASTPFTIFDEPNGKHVFSDPGSYQVTLTVSNTNQTRSHTQTIEILTNELDDNSIIYSNGRLSSVKSAQQYQWYKDGIEIPGEVGRSYAYSGIPGTYFVLTKAEVCNRISSPYVVLSAFDEEKVDLDYFDVFPNPTNDILNIRLNGLVNGAAEIRLINAVGRIVLVKTVNVSEILIETHLFSEGIYIIEITSGSKVHRKRVSVVR